MSTPKMKNSTQRSFGSFEKGLWLTDQMETKDFAFIAELEGNATPEEWQSALRQVQLHHENLSSRVNTNATSHLVLEPTDAPIPFKIIEADEQVSWQKTVEEERTVAFDITAPVMRVVVLQQQATSTLILLANHSVFDGMSLIYITRDILSAINNQFSPVPTPAKSLDEVVGFSTDHPQQAADLLNGSRQSEVYGLVQNVKLSAASTSKLITRCRAEQTSVHGALSAAVLIAGRKRFSHWTEKAVHLVSAVNVRKALNIGETSGVYFITEAFDLQPDQESIFWDIARQVKSTFTKDQKAYTAAFIAQLQQLVFHIPDSQQILEIMKKAFEHQVMISNLGQLPYESDFGKLKIKDFWGPVIMAGNGEIPTVGAVTVNGSLHLTNTSELPLPQFLETIVEILEAACNS